MVHRVYFVSIGQISFYLYPQLVRKVNYKKPVC